MKLSLLTTATFGAAVQAHGFFQKLSVNGVEKPSLSALRVPPTNNPVQDVTSSALTCGAAGTTSKDVLSVNPGDDIGIWFQHIIGGPQGANDVDNPIAASHKGPVMVYLAKVSDAATSSSAGLGWFKIYEDAFDTATKTWGVDDLIADNGWTHFTLPKCLAPGQYLARFEIIALHSAYSQGGAQFYSSCGQFNVGGSGTLAPATVSFPGAYKAADPGITINIYGSSGKPDNNGKAYTAPGPAVVQC